MLISKFRWRKKQPELEHATLNGRAQVGSKFRALSNRGRAPWGAAQVTGEPSCAAVVKTSYGAQILHASTDFFMLVYGRHGGKKQARIRGGCQRQSVGEGVGKDTARKEFETFSALGKVIRPARKRG